MIHLFNSSNFFFNILICMFELFLCTVHADFMDVWYLQGGDATTGGSWRHEPWWVKSNSGRGDSDAASPGSQAESQSVCRGEWGGSAAAAGEGAACHWDCLLSREVGALAFAVPLVVATRHRHAYKPKGIVTKLKLLRLFYIHGKSFLNCSIYFCY